MMFRKLMILPAVAAGMTALLAGARPAWAESYTVDPVHSNVLFRIAHMNAGAVWGWFANPEGTFEYDPKAPEKTTLDVKLTLANLNTANAMRDTHLKTKDYFDAETYPTITFKSTKVEVKEQGYLAVTGDLTLRGVTKPITATVHVLGNSAMEGTTRQGVEATFTVNRVDFGIAPKIPNEVLGNEVKLVVSLEGLNPPPAKP